jgi:hypothetical protein
MPNAHNSVILFPEERRLREPKSPRPNERSENRVLLGTKLVRP